MTDYWQQIISDAREFRRELHVYPEIAWEEERTARRIREELSALAIDWRPCAGTGTVARLNPDGAGRHIALRGDIDALPMDEYSGRPWTSATAGRMHACGHDGHTAALMAAARWLKHVEWELPGPVSLLFQPAEEGGHGARYMIEDGALEGVDEIFGWHNWPAIPFGQLVCPDGIVMCGNGTFTLTVIGSGGHASQPELCRDPVLAASAITLALQQIVSRRLPPQRAAVVSVTSIDAPSGASTITPSRAVIGGSYRVPDDETREIIKRLVREISEATATAYGVECEVALHPRYDATINYAPQADRLRRAWQRDNGGGALDGALPLPIMASEDFSYYLREIPGAFALIGANDGDGHSDPCHSVSYDFNDRLIDRVARLYARLAGAPLP